MNVRTFLSTAATLAALAAPSLARAQISITPMVGGYVKASDLNQVTTGAQNVAESRQGSLSLGLNLDLSSALRASLMYASGTTIQNASRQDVGKGNMFAAAGDLVIRPLPRILVQPYLIAGAGEKFFKFDQSSSLVTGGDSHVLALHGGVGADLMLGPIGVAAELTDFVSRANGNSGSWNVHDAFLMLGAKLRVGN